MTKALIRNEGETITEDCGLSFIDWNTGAPLTDPEWYRGPYALVQNYVPAVNDEPVQHDEIIEPKQVEIENENDYVVIEGKKYSKTELRSLLE